MKNKILSIIFVLILFLQIPVFAEIESSVLNEELAPIEEISEINPNAGTEKAFNQNDNPNINISQAETSVPHKQPISKRKLVKMFAFAMLLVGISLFVIYFGLIIYQKYSKGIPNQIKTPEGETPLTTPKDLENGAKIFLEKTKWQ